MLCVVDSFKESTSRVPVCKMMLSIPDSVSIEIKNCSVFITGTLGVLIFKLHKSVGIKLNSFNILEIYLKNYDNGNKALIGTTRSIINGMIVGVTSGFTKKLQLVGIGYRVSIQNNVLNLVVGLSHVVNYTVPDGVSAKCLNQTEIVLNSTNKQLIGQVAADLRKIRPPEPFKGKGIRYSDEVVHNKDSKKR